MPQPASDALNHRSELTRDQFLSGRVKITQPKIGFRAGMDTMLLAASLAGQTQSILELGAGVGTASICALADLSGVNATLVEMQPDLAALARQNLTDNEFNARAEVIEADVTASGAARLSAGIKTDHYTSVIANPPFFESGAGTLAPDDKRATSRHMRAGALDKWVKTAAASAAPHGEIIFVHAITALPDLVHAFASRFGSICIWPIAPRPGAEATRVLIRGIKGSRAPLRLLTPMILHEATGNQFAPEIDIVFRGDRRLDW